jgi:hypothetical protein
VNDDLPEPELRPDEPRRYPSTLGGAIYIVVALTTAAGLGLIAIGPWRAGLATMGGALIAGAVARLVLNDDNAGMLKVRRKSLDVLFMAGLGASLIALSIAVPNQPG